MPKISIITPVYCDTSHKVDWLDEMIQSVQGQTLTDWEMILINDKSPLPLDPVKMRHAGDGRLRWFENAKNFGPAMTRNTAVLLAEAECILPLDSDDMLANEETLETMYDAWIMDETKTVYGDVQLYKRAVNGFERSKTHQLAHYSFEGAMNLQFGIMPVTTMHSKEAHYAAGGWKPELAHGREDLEYWISCGKAGFCGLKISYTTLLYRKHEQSRDFRLIFELNELSAMQQKIKAMHSDVYNGRFPMACCGKGATSATPANDPAIISQQAMSKEVRIVTALDGYDEKDLEWVAYRGPKQGRSGSILARGPRNTPSEYPVLGTGHVFQIHKDHRKLFEDRQKLGFEMNQPDPRVQPEPEVLTPPVEQVVAEVIEVPKPELSTVVSLDSVAAETREAEVQPAQNSNVDEMITKFKALDWQLSSNIDELKLGAKVTETLRGASYTVEKLAVATSQELATLPGIGIKTANKIIAKAVEFLES
jgi:teichuronic acid biosynthesis glycosyltransferase TuaG